MFPETFPRVVILHWQLLQSGPKSLLVELKSVNAPQSSSRAHASLNSNCWFSSERVLHIYIDCDVWKPGISCFADSFILKFFVKRLILIIPWFFRHFITPIDFFNPNSTCGFDIRCSLLLSLFIGKQCGTNLLLFMEADVLRHALIQFFLLFFLFSKLNLTLQIRGTWTWFLRAKKKNKGFCLIKNILQLLSLNSFY